MPKAQDLVKDYPGYQFDGSITPKRNAQGDPIPGQWQAVLRPADGQGPPVVITLEQPPESQLGPSGAITAQTDLSQVDWSVAGVEGGAGPGDSAAEKNARVEQATAAATNARAQAAQARAQLADLEKLDANRQKNVGARNLYMTDEEIAAMDKQLADQGLQRAQIDAQLKIAADNNRLSAAANQISATNAATSASKAAHDALIDEQRIKLEENKQATEKDLAQARQQFDIENAKFNQELAQDKLKLDQLTQRQTNEQTAEANRLRGTEGGETARANKAREDQQKADAAQRALEAKQTAEAGERNTAVQAASQTYGAERTAQSAAANTGANLINQRLSSAQGMLSNILGIASQGQSSSGRFGPLGGGLHGMPAGFDATQLLGGIQGYTAELGGGQQVYDAAARMVQQAGGNTLTPQGQAAYGVLAQMLERYKALSGSDHPAVTATTAANATGPATGVASPATGAPVAGPAAPPAVPVMGGAAAPAVVTNAQTFTSPSAGQPFASGQTGSFGITQPMADMFNQQRQQAFASPPAPTVVINT